MSMKHLSLGLQAVVRHMDEGVGFRVNDRRVGDLFKLITAGHTFTLIVVNPEEQEVIILGEEEMFREPKIFILEGANWGGSLVKMGYVLTGCYVKVRPLVGDGFMLLPIIEDFAEFDGTVSEETKTIMAKAEESRPRQMTEAEIAKIKEAFWKWVDGYMWGEHKAAAYEMINRFCFLNGQAYIGAILVAALEANKLPTALKLLEKQYAEHWYFRPDSLRGELITPSDVHYLELAYAELGITPPGRAS